MIRWSYVVTRLLFVAAILTVAWLLLNPVLRWGLVLSGQSVLGSKVEIGSVLTNLKTGRMELTDIAIADPSKPLNNLANIERASFDVESSAVLKKRLIISEGRISGLTIHSGRSSSGVLEKDEEEATPEGPTMTDKIGDMGEEWLDSSLENLEHKIEEDLHSVRLAKDLKKRWPQKYESLEGKAKHIVDEGEALVKKIESLSEKPLDHLEQIPATLAEIDQLRQKATSLKSELADAKNQIATDKAAIQAAKQHDQQFIKEKLDFESLDGESLTEYLLGPELHGKAETAIAWIRWYRGMTKNDVVEKPEERKERGVTVLFPSMRSNPDFLIRKLLLDGSGTVDSKPYQFTGTVNDITHQSMRHDRPMTVNIAGDGAIQFDAKGTFERRGTPTESLEIDIPALAMSERVLGKPEKIAVRVSEGKASVKANLVFSGEQISGHIQFLQPNVVVQPNMAQLESKEILASDVSQAFQGIRNIEANVDLSGNFKRPKFNLQSNLGDQLAVAFNQMLQQELAARQDQLVSMANQLVDKEIQKFETQISAKHSDILGKLQIDQKLSGVKTQVAGLIGADANLLKQGKKLFNLLKR